MEGVHYIANTTGELIFLLDINKYEKVDFDLLFAIIFL